MIYQEFFTEEFDEDGILQGAALRYPENFNFAYDVIDVLAERQAETLAMLWRDDNGNEERLRFSDIARTSRKVARLLRDWGLEKGDVLMVCLRCRHEYWSIALAAHRLGILLCPVFHLLSEEDFLYRLEVARPKAIICLAEGKAPQTLLRAARRAGVSRLYAVGGSAAGFADFAAELARAQELRERVETRAAEPILLYFTSGSTGAPKGVLHNHAFLFGTVMGARYLQDNGPHSLHFASGNSAWEVVCGTKFYGQWFCESAIFVYDFERFHPEKLLSQLEELKVTSMMAQPTVYRQLTEVGMDRFDLSGLQTFSVGGEKLTQELTERVYEQTGARLYEGYAQSEAGLISANSRRMGFKEGSVGRALPKYHIEILKEDGSFAADGEAGELVILADAAAPPVGLLMGYFNDPEATEAIWDGEVFHSGDWVFRDEEGFLFYLGRMDGLIKSRGYRISPFEIENVLLRHPAVYECMVVGEEDALWGERVCAYVSLAEGVSPDESTRAQLLDFYNQDCAGFQKIRALRFVPLLERNGNGKLIRNQFAKR